MLKLSDVYTGTKSADNIIIQGQAGAEIRLLNEELPTYAIPVRKINQNGELLLEDVPTGQYACRIKAPDHEDYIGNFYVKPGLTTMNDVFWLNKLWKIS